MKSNDLSQHSPKQRILEVAATLFYSEGIRAVGVDRIIAEAEVAKASFYKHFSSKDNLIVAYLHRRDAMWRNWLKTAVEKISSQPKDKPLAVFDALAQRFALKDFRGCAFGNTVVELADRDHPAHKTAETHKQEVTAYVAQLLDEAGYVETEDLSAAFMILIDGATVVAVRDGVPDAAHRARHVASLLLENVKTKPPKK